MEPYHFFGGAPKLGRQWTDCQRNFLLDNGNLATRNRRGGSTTLVVEPPLTLYDFTL